jgi:hypothetical protein
VSKVELDGTLLVHVENLTDQSHNSSTALPKQRDPQTRLLKAMTRPPEHDIISLCIGRIFIAMNLERQQMFTLKAWQRAAKYGFQTHPEFFERNFHARLGEGCT